MSISLIEEKWQQYGRLKKLVLSLVWFGILMLFSFLVILKPLYLQRDTIQQQVAALSIKLRQQQQKLQTERKSLQSFEYRSPEVKPLAVNEQNSWLNQFIEQCNKQNVSVHSLQWGRPILQQGYEVSTLHLNIQGEYQALLQCVNSIEQASTFSTISQFSLQVMDARLLQMQLDVQAYQLPSDWKMAHLNYLAPDFSIIQDPFYRKLNSKSPANSIHSYALSQLQLLGSIQVNQNDYAIIATPSGEVYHAKVGSSIGLEQAKLIKVQRQDVLLKTVSGRELCLRLAGN